MSGICDACQKDNHVYKSGWVRKSPPQDRINIIHGFKKRWGTLGRFRLCGPCAEKEQLVDGSLALVFSYYKDDSESKVKGIVL